MDNQSDKIIVYEKSICTKCREVKKILDEAGVTYETVEYYHNPISEAKLKDLVVKMGINVKDLVRTNEDTYKELGLAEKNLSFDEVVSVLVNNPELMQRPIVEKGDRAVLGRPPENVKSLL